MINIYNNTSRKKVAVFENAFNIEETEHLNGVSELLFSMPATDPKLEHGKHFNLVRWKDKGNLYRLIDNRKEEEEQRELQKLQSEHVIATLIDDVVFGTLQLDNLTTREVLERILANQTVKHWRLGDCEFTRRFSYSWSNENLLTALFSIPNRFDTGYRWVFNTDTYPWVVHLRTLDTTKTPDFYVRKGKNAIAQYKTSKGRDICTVLYPLGYGEGVNQLTIKDVNGGKPYLEASSQAIAQYGRISRIWEDLRYEIPEHLLERGKVILDKLSKPFESYEMSVADLEGLSLSPMDRAEAGKVIRFNDETTFITKVKRYLDVVKPYMLEIANQPEDVATSIADLADRQRISSVYAQGATCLYSQAFNDNADETHPATIQFYVPSEARQINKVILTWTLERFRAYNTGAEAGGATNVSSSSGGSSNPTSSSGGGSTQTSSGGGSSTATSSSGGGSSLTSNNSGGTSKSTDSGGGTTQTSAASGQANITSGSSSLYTSEGPQGPIKAVGGTTDVASGLGKHTHGYYSFLPYHAHGINHNHSVTTLNHSHGVSIPSHAHNFSVPAHAHTISISSHRHTTSIPSHTHSVGIPNHTHSVGISNHNHSVEIENHTHKMIYGIYEGNRATTVMLRVDGKTIPIGATQREIDVATFLSVDGGGKIRRGTYHKIEIIPNSLTRISATLSVQLFVQSEGGGLY